MKTFTIPLSLSLAFIGLLITLSIAKPVTRASQSPVQIDAALENSDYETISLLGKGFSPDARVFLSENSDQSPSGFANWGLVQDMEVDNDTLYVANNTKGFTIVDIRDANKPQILSSLKTPYKCFDLEIAYPYLFSLTPTDKAQANSSIVTIYDISNSKFPQYVDSVSIPQGLVMHYDGTALYVGGQAGIVSYDVSVGSLIKQNVLVSDDFVVTNIAPVGDELMFSAYGGGLYLVKSSGQIEVLAGDKSQNGIVIDIVSSEYVYVLRSYYGRSESSSLEVYTIDGYELESIDLAGSGLKMAAAEGGGVYVSVKDIGIEQFRFTGAGLEQHKVSSISFAGREFVVYKSAAFVPRASKDEIVIVELSRDIVPTEVNYLHTGVSVLDLLEMGGDRYISSTLASDEPLKRISNDNSRIFEVESVPLAGYVGSFGNILFSYNNSGVFSYQKEGNTFTPIDSKSLVGQPLGIVVTPSHLYLLDKGRGISVLRHYPDGNMVKVSEVAINEKSYRLMTFENCLVVSKNKDGLDFFSLDDPDYPLKISEFNFPSPYKGFAEAWGGSYYNGKLFVAGGEDGVFVLSVDDIIRPYLQNILPTRGYVSIVDTIGDILLVKENKVGISYYSLSESDFPILIDTYYFSGISRFWHFGTTEILLSSSKGIKTVPALIEISDFYVVSDNRLLVNLPVQEGRRFEKIHVQSGDEISEYVLH